MIVTIVTPTLNAVEYLKECIESARRNTTKDIEIEHVIVDGGSTDGTVELARSYGLRVLQGKDSGIFDAINKGSFDSSGELLGFLGADDVMLDGASSAVVQAYRKSGRRWVVGGIKWTDSKGHSLGRLAAPPNWMTPAMLVSLGWNPIMHMGTYFSRSFFEELGGFNITYKDSGDYEMFCRALTKAPYGRIDQTLACFRRTGMNNSAIHGSRTAAEWARILAEHGPSSNAQRVFWRCLLKGYFNLGNPDWLLAKMADSTRTTLKLQPKPHF
ncbi:glycosyltransferase family 2 protein [Bosea sp. NBC_00550]|uniref:glycosyltransferase family 2 protein n=1 Tax=Bosea sp. NBC_00550 TaxID=2969621 RepID=UPI002230F02F|nr:glycosyltransferase family 2 protein [Bosea sp. NBC_00550]UZF91572.1 glycosyltransferase [Bosea sp. NBC_00550]